MAGFGGSGYRLQVTSRKVQQIEIKEVGVYEIYLDTAGFPRAALPSFKIRVDGKEMLQATGYPVKLRNGAGRQQVASRKYIKIAQVEIKEPGKHEIEVMGATGNPENKKQKMVLVNKRERLKIEKLIRQRMDEPGGEAAYIFSREGEFWVK